MVMLYNPRWQVSRSHHR